MEEGRERSEVGKRKRRKRQRRREGRERLAETFKESQRSLQGSGTVVITLAAGPRQRVAAPLSLGGGRQGYFSTVYSSAISLTSAVSLAAADGGENEKLESDNDGD